MLKMSQVEVNQDAVLRPEPSKCGMDTLTGRERQIMRLIALGHQNRVIAEMLQISSKTVDTHRGKVLSKLAIRNNSDITWYAIKHGVISIEDDRIERSAN